LLDLSAAFDTVDTRLKVSFGVSGAALDWFRGRECETRFGSVDTKDRVVWRN